MEEQQVSLSTLAAVNGFIHNPFVTVVLFVQVGQEWHEVLTVERCPDGGGTLVKYIHSTDYIRNIVVDADYRFGLRLIWKGKA